MYSMCAGLLTALTSSQSSHCSCCNLTFMRCHFSVDYQLDRCPALQCTHCHPFHWGLCKRGNFALLSVLPAAFERQGAGEGAWGKEERGATRKKREDKAGGHEEKVKQMRRYGMMKGRRITYGKNQLWSIMSSLPDHIFSLLSSILLSSTHHGSGRWASIINLRLSFRWWIDIRPFHRWMQPQRKDFFSDLCPGAMVSHNTYTCSTEFSAFWE